VYHRNNKHSSDKIINMNMYSVLIDQVLIRHQDATNRHANIDQQCGDQPSEISIQTEHDFKGTMVTLNALKRLINLKQVLTNSDKAFILDVMALAEARHKRADKREEELSEQEYRKFEEMGPPSSM
jgi:hypothetical protein